MDTSIIKQIRKELTDYQNNVIDIGGGVKYNQYAIVRRINFYKNSQYESGEYDSQGQRKFFYNISRFRATTISKMLDFDRKDLRVLTKKVHDIISQLKSYLVRKKLENWMDKNNFGVIQNKVADSLGTYGTAILYKEKNGIPSTIDIKDIQAMDTTVDDIRDSSHLIFTTTMPLDQIEAKRSVWDKVDEVITRAKEEEKDEIKIYTRYGVVEENGEYIKKLTIVANAEDVSCIENQEIENGIILFNEEIKEYPFRSVKINEIKGRFLGVGAYEEMFESQIRINELVNQKANSLRLSSKQIYTTQDDLIAQNLLTDIDTGDILITSGLQQVQTESRALSEYASEEARWDLLADRLTFTYDSVRGEALPATTPATNAVLQNRNVQSVFEYMRENVANFFSKYIEELILPEILKKQDYIIRFKGSIDELNKFDEIVSKLKVGEYEWNYLQNTGYWLDDSEKEAVKQEIINELKQAGIVRAIEIPKGFFKGILNDITVEFDNEGGDKALEAGNLLGLIQMLSQNQQALSNPVLKKLIYRYAEILGISPVELELAQSNEESNRQTEANPSQPIQVRGLESGQRSLPANLGGLAQPQNING